MKRMRIPQEHLEIAGEEYDPDYPSEPTMQERYEESHASHEKRKPKPKRQKRKLRLEVT